MKRTLLILISAATVASLAGCALFYPNIGSNETPSDPLNPSPSTSVSASPSGDPTPSAEPTVLKGEAKPRLLFYNISDGTLQVIGEVINFAEDGGECIITFYSGNTPIILERVPAEHNVSTTQCFPLDIGLSRLPQGIGYVEVGYESENYEGVSEKFEVIIP
jgi:hypothetical protein